MTSANNGASHCNVSVITRFYYLNGNTFLYFNPITALFIVIHRMSVKLRVVLVIISFRQSFLHQLVILNSKSFFRHDNEKALKINYKRFNSKLK